MPSAGKKNPKLENGLDHKEIEALTIRDSIWTSSSGKQKRLYWSLEGVLAFFIHFIEYFNRLMNKYLEKLNNG